MQDPQPFKLIWLTRHAQGYHNEQHNWNYIDPLLTHRGLIQSTKISQKVNSHLHRLRANPNFKHLEFLPDPDSNVLPFDVVVCSPMRRTIQTALFALAAHHDPTLPTKPVHLYPYNMPIPNIVLVPEFTESGRYACNYAVPLPVLHDTFPQLEVAGRIVVPTGKYTVEEWPRVAKDYADDVELLEWRIEYVKKWLWERPERSIMVVSHCCFLEELLVSCGQYVEQFRNAEVRVAKLFKDGDF
ncbi:hypothetical protein HK096_010212, partial [Nowakowskiella sp. JEL0078]